MVCRVWLVVGGGGGGGVWEDFGCGGDLLGFCSGVKGQRKWKKRGGPGEKEGGGGRWGGAGGEKEDKKFVVGLFGCKGGIGSGFVFVVAGRRGRRRGGGEEGKEGGGRPSYWGDWGVGRCVSGGRNERGHTKNLVCWWVGAGQKGFGGCVG